MAQCFNGYNFCLMPKRHEIEQEIHQLVHSCSLAFRRSISKCFVIFFLECPLMQQNASFGVSQQAGNSLDFQEFSRPELQHAFAVAKFQKLRNNLLAS